MAGRVRADGAAAARRVNAAAGLLAQGHRPEAVRGVLVARFGISDRQARRYVAQATASGPVAVPEASVVFTVKVPTSLARRVRERARATGATISSLVAGALSEFLDGGPGRG